MPHVLIICPLKKELVGLTEGFAKLGWEFESQATNRLSLSVERSRGVTLAIGGHGKAQFGVQTQHLLAELGDVTKMICVGAGGGLAEHLVVGDLVVGVKTLEHDYAERFSPDAKIPEFTAHENWIENAKRVASASSYKVYFGVVASGDEDIVDAHRARELYMKTGALAVAWEGSGGARACLFNSIPFIELRAITDNARDSVPESFAKNLARCMHNAAHFIHHLLAV
jgi:adenosylhomocysteine nucleosidase